MCTRCASECVVHDRVITLLYLQNICIGSAAQEIDTPLAHRKAYTHGRETAVRLASAAR